jgi:hypothetical protein
MPGGGKRAPPIAQIKVPVLLSQPTSTALVVHGHDIERMSYSVAGDFVVESHRLSVLRIVVIPVQRRREFIERLVLIGYGKIACLN